MVRVGCALVSLRSSCSRAGEIPTWQWLWSVLAAITWDAFVLCAARRNTPQSVRITRSKPGVDATLNTPSPTHPPAQQHERGRPVARRRKAGPTLIPSAAGPSTDITEIDKSNRKHDMISSSSVYACSLTAPPRRSKFLSPSQRRRAAVGTAPLPETRSKRT
ncbi:unnamed protein product [Pleuronectes platessa]|uniref:Uncharacterized protein n=1 Tax=Pleuronectes platessa TaxID=8262 RepID=A0A9N7VGP3_PLEPL|nr:unnamed protein product [Pleuronectes platessa]